MDTFCDSSSLWDSRHDWILQYDNLLKHSVKNNSQGKGTNLENKNSYTSFE